MSSPDDPREEIPEDVWERAGKLAGDIMGKDARPLTILLAEALMEERREVLDALDIATTVLRSMAEHAKEHGHIIESMYAMNIANMYGKPQDD